MNTYTFDKKTKTVKVHKDCQKCSHVKVCVFHDNVRELASKDVMFRMNQYLETNNVLRTFELYSNCSHYKTKYNHAKAESPNLDSDIEIINWIMADYASYVKNNLLREKYKEHVEDTGFFFSPIVEMNIKADSYRLTLKTTNKEIGHGTIVYDASVKISDVLKKWKFE